jgi:hypothetical protein
MPHNLTECVRASVNGLILNLPYIFKNKMITVLGMGLNQSSYYEAVSHWMIISNINKSDFRHKTQNNNFIQNHQTLWILILCHILFLNTITKQT